MEDVTISHRDSQPIAMMRATCRMSELGQRLGKMLPAVKSAIDDQGVAPAAPPLMRYLSMNMEDETLEFEAGFALAKPYSEVPPVRAGILPGGKAASLWHVGPYEALGASHERLDAWLGEHRRRPGGERWEVYWTDPGEEPDPAKWRTEIVQPLAP